MSLLFVERDSFCVQLKNVLQPFSWSGYFCCFHLASCIFKCLPFLLIILSPPIVSQFELKLGNRYFSPKKPKFLTSVFWVSIFSCCDVDKEKRLCEKANMEIRSLQQDPLEIGRKKLLGLRVPWKLVKAWLCRSKKLLGLRLPCKLLGCVAIRAWECPTHTPS